MKKPGHLYITFCSANFFKKSFIKNTSLFKKGLIATFPAESLTKGPIRRDKPAQRLRVNGCGSTVSANG
jgi:hypothetical protein